MRRTKLHGGGKQEKEASGRLRLGSFYRGVTEAEAPPGTREWVREDPLAFAYTPTPQFGVHATTAPQFGTGLGLRCVRLPRIHPLMPRHGHASCNFNKTDHSHISATVKACRPNNDASVADNARCPRYFLRRQFSNRQTRGSKNDTRPNSDIKDVQHARHNLNIVWWKKFWS